MAWPVILAIAGAVVGGAAKAKAARDEGKARAAQLQQEALAAQQDAAALRLDAEALRFDAAAVRNQGDMVLAEADAADYNAALADQNAVLTRQAAAENARRLRVQTTKQLGSIRARYGASGVALSGSALDVLEESAAAAELDRLTVIHEGDVKAIAFDNEAQLNRMKSGSARKNAASIIERAGFVDAKADFVDEQADFTASKTAFYNDQAKRAKKAGNLAAVGAIAGSVTSAATLYK